MRQRNKTSYHSFKKCVKNTVKLYVGIQAFIGALLQSTFINKRKVTIRTPTRLHLTKQFFMNA